MANVCDKFRQNFKQTFIEQVAHMFSNLSIDKWFLSIGKPLPWVSESGTEDGFPPAASDTEATEVDFWSNIIAHKRITEEDVSIVVPRYDWTLGTVYDPFRNDVDLLNVDDPSIFYVLVDEERVYKCIDNNYGAPSTIAPTHTDTDIKKLSDGYRWKYMYSIPETKRKFLTKGGLRQDGVIRAGYMPVEKLEMLGMEDERYLQFAVQNAAVDGEVVFIYFLPEYRDYVISDACVFSSTSNLITSDVFAGGTTAYIYSGDLVPVANYYNDMIISIDGGNGQGQRRVISSYTPSGANSALVSVTNPFTVSLSGSVSQFSIVPNIYLQGSHRSGSRDNTLNPLMQYADVSVRFSTTTTGQARYVDSFEMVDTGQNYNTATFKVVKGLTFASNTPSALITSFENIAEPIISPQGGHGSNPVAELGGRALMINKKYSGSEGGKLTTQNEFRQFGIIKNPLLSNPYYRISTVQQGTPGAFVVGATAYQAATGGHEEASGKVVSWYVGLTGYTGTSELVVTNVSGMFEAGAMIGTSTGSASISVFDVMERTIAGTEGRDLLVLTLAPSTDTRFSSIVDEFPRGLNAVAVGNQEENVMFSGSKGVIYRWQPSSGMNNSGRLFLEHSHGEFMENELVGVRDRYMTLYSGLTGIGKIIEKTTMAEDFAEIYDQTHKLIMNAAAGDTFSDSSFVLDSTVEGFDGATAVSTGYVVNWIPSGATGELSVISVVGDFVAGETIKYTNAEGNTANALVDILVSEVDLVYRSGQVQYIQNMRPIVRSEEQEEEIKLVIEI